MEGVVNGPPTGPAWTTSPAGVAVMLMPSVSSTSWPVLSGSSQLDRRELTVPPPDQDLASLPYQSEVWLVHEA